VNPSVVFTPEAEDQLAELYRYIATAGSAEVAARYTEAIVAYCEELAAFPHRGSARDDIARDDIRSGLRTIGFRRRVVIAFAVLDQTVAIIGVFYGGRDYEAVLSDPEGRTAIGAR
jgi:plasmid stabilization system protein ParE